MRIKGGVLLSTGGSKGSNLRMGNTKRDLSKIRQILEAMGQEENSRRNQEVQRPFREVHQMYLKI